MVTAYAPHPVIGGTDVARLVKNRRDVEHAVDAAWRANPHPGQPNPVEALR
jgi:hypothetical protein